jgi:hypothetical protein
MSHKVASTEVVATIGIDLGKNTFHVIGFDDSCFPEPPAPTPEPEA